MDGIDNNNKTKKIIVFSFIFLLTISILIGGLLFLNKSKEKKIKKEKEKKAAELKPDIFLSKFSKEKWNETFGLNCLQKKESLYKEKFSWLDEEANPQLIEGYMLKMSFKMKNSSKCCGSVSKLGVKIKDYFNSQDFVENLTNTNSESNVYAFENLNFKCVYGYGEVENKEKFCNFSIICGKVINSLIGSDFSKIYGVYNPEKKSDRMVIVDKFLDIPEGSFARGRIINGFYFDAPKKFIAMKSVKGEWSSFGDPFGVTRIDSCWNLLNNNCPPVVVDNKCYDEEKKDFVRYDVLYEEKNR